MPKVTSKLQLTVPKVIADRYHIRPGDHLDWVPAGDVIRVIPQNVKQRTQRKRSIEERLRLFRDMIERQKHREQSAETVQTQPERPWKPDEIARGWRREDLYTRGRSD
jgi:bifunctional DNA-binding transcriptional regulator/antitoxin component of YhaV-PrlF toxin-antitoxin module